MKKYFILFLILLGLSTPLTRTIATDDIAFTTTRLNKFGSVVIRASNLFGFDIAGFVMPFFTKPEEIAAPDFEPANDFTGKINQRIFPQGILDKGKVIPWTDDITLKSLYGAILKTDQQYSNHPPPTDCFISVTQQKTDPVPFAPSLFQNLESIDAFWGLMPKKTESDGILNFNRPDKALGGMNPAEDCKKHDFGKELPSVENDTPKLASFQGDVTIQGEIIQTVTEIVTKIIQGFAQLIEKPITEQHKDDVILTEKKRLPWFQFLCHVYKCPGKELGEETAGLDKKGGFANAFFSPEHQIPVIPAGVHPMEISVAGFKQRPFEASFDNENQADWGLRRLGCVAAPYGMQQKLSVGKTRPIAEFCNPPPKLDCPIDLIEQGKAKNDTSCNLKNAGAYKSSNEYLSDLEKSSLPKGIPPLMQKVLNAAGATYNVPASVLLATMLEEGSFEHAGTWDWTDENVRKFSDCTTTDPMPSCRDFASQTSEGATGPFGFIQTWWDKYINSGGPYKAYENDTMWKDVIEKSKENISMCNFTDAAFSAARELGEDQSHYQPAYVPLAPTSCTFDGTTYTTNISDVPSSCSDWSADRAAMARLQYSDRVCDETVNRTIKTYKNF